MARVLREKVVLVVGGAGFIGSHFVDHLLQEYSIQHIYLLDSFFTGNEKNILQAIESGRATLYRDNAEDRAILDYIFSVHDIDYVFDFATKPLNYSFINPSSAFSVNTKVTQNLLECLRSGSYRTLCHLSTSEVYGSSQINCPLTEESPFRPTTAYAAGKAAADLLISAYVQMFSLDVIIIRPFNNYGPRQNSKGSLAGLIPRTIERIFSDLPPVIHGDGQNSRNYVFVSDTVRLIAKLFQVMDIGTQANICSQIEASVVDIVEIICSKLNYPIAKVIYESARPADVIRHLATNKYQQKLSPITYTSLEEGLSQTIGWYVGELSSK